MKKILFFVDSLGVGGLQNVFVRTINGIDISKYDIEVLLLYNAGKLIEDLRKDIVCNYIFEEKYMIRGYTYFYKYAPLKSLVKKIFNNDYDVIVAFGEGPCTQLLSKYKGNAKKVCWLHSSYDKAAMKVLNGTLKKTKKIYSAYDRIICVSSDVKKHLEECIGINENIDVLVNPINSDAVSECAKENVTDIILDKNYTNFISVGRFETIKGYERLINIFSKMVKEGYSSIRLYLIGLGSLENRYEELIKKNNMENHITIIGYRENPIKYVAQCDVYVCSSFIEGFSTAVVEAILAGTLVITTDCGGMKDILGYENDYGIIVENSEEALYNGIKQIIENRNIIRSYNKRIEDRAKDFDYKTSIDNIMECLSNL